MGNQNCNICLSNNTQHPDAKHKGFSDEVQTIIDKYRRKSIKNIEAFE